MQTLPFDGSYISTPVVELLPTSRGSITLANTDPTADPIIDPNYLATATDRAALRTGLRTAMRAFESEAGQRIVLGGESSQPPGPDMEPLTANSTDAQLDQRLRATCRSFFQGAGTASMGSVVDTALKVKGVDNLRVCDMSVVPLPLAAYSQAQMYAIAESAADLITGQA